MVKVPITSTAAAPDDQRHEHIRRDRTDYLIDPAKNGTASAFALAGLMLALAGVLSSSSPSPVRASFRYSGQ